MTSRFIGLTALPATATRSCSFRFESIRPIWPDGDVSLAPSSRPRLVGKCRHPRTAGQATARSFRMVSRSNVHNGGHRRGIGPNSPTPHQSSMSSQSSLIAPCQPLAGIYLRW